jgi:hypothetical protein
MLLVAEVPGCEWQDKKNPAIKRNSIAIGFTKILRIIVLKFTG